MAKLEFTVIRELHRRELLKRLWKAAPALAGGGALLFLTRPTPRGAVVEIPGLQQALRYLGYLPESHQTQRMDKETERALLRFKRHARRPYRVLAASGAPDDVPLHGCFAGECDLDLGEPTARELLQWLGRGWRLPLGRFRLESLAAGDPRAPRALRWSQMREDVAAEWRKVMAEVNRLGGTVDGPYGDTWRPLGFHHKPGASQRSFHITGRAIDLNQNLAHGRQRRYMILADPQRGREYWRILCRTEKQDGSQGEWVAERSKEGWAFLPPRTSPVPAGYYIDLTAVLERHGFERVPARSGWEQKYLHTEWWHYHYARDKQETFLDECELVGISEQQLLRAGYTFEEMDRSPG